MVVLLTDGRANVSLAKSNDDPDAIGPDAVKPTTVRTCLVFHPSYVIKGRCSNAVQSYALVMHVKHEMKALEHERW